MYTAEKTLQSCLRTFLPVLQNAFGQNIKILGRGRHIGESLPGNAVGMAVLSASAGADSQKGSEPPAVVRIMSEGNEVPVLWVLFWQARTGSRSRCSTLD